MAPENKHQGLSSRPPCEQPALSAAHLFKEVKNSPIIPAKMCYRRFVSQPIELSLAFRKNAQHLPKMCDDADFKPHNEYRVKFKTYLTRWHNILYQRTCICRGFDERSVVEDTQRCSKEYHKCYHLSNGNTGSGQMIRNGFRSVI